MANEINPIEHPVGPESVPTKEGFLRMSAEEERRRSSFLTAAEKLKIAVMELDKDSEQGEQLLKLLNRLAIDYDLACASGDEEKKRECEQTLEQLKSSE